MAITLDAVSDSSAVAPVSGVVTFSATTNAGSNGVLTVAAASRTATIAGVTFNGHALTLAIEDVGSNGLYASVWYWVTPDVGTFNVVVTASNTTPDYVGACAISMFGVDGTPVEASQALETTGANPAFTSLTTLTDGSAVVDCMASNWDTPATMNAETNRVQRANFLALSQNRGVGMSSIITKSPAGSVTMGWNIASFNSAYVGAAFKPFSGVAGTPFFMQLGAQRI